MINKDNLVKNLFSNIDFKANEELIEVLGKGSNFKIERIVSTGQNSPEGFWYDQNQNELVFLLEGKSTLLIEEDGKIVNVNLEKGDYLMIKAHTKHRVEYTSIDPPCVWLAFHGDFSNNEKELV